MDILGYLLSRFVRLNDLKTEDPSKQFGMVSPPTVTGVGTGVVGYKSTGIKYRGTKQVNFNKIDIGALFKNVPPVIWLFQPKNHRDIIGAVFDYYGLGFANTAEVLADFVPTVVDPLDFAKVTTIKAYGSSIWFRGQLDVDVRQKVMALDEIVQDRELAVLVDKYPLSNELLVAEKKYYHYDFTFSPYLPNIKAFRAGEAIGPPTSWAYNCLRDADVVQECGDIPWTLSSLAAGAQYNTYQFTSMYNGPTSGYPDANQNFANVCVIWDKKSKGTNNGLLYLHYD